MDFLATPIPGCVLIRPSPHDDARGRFVKTYHADRFAAHGIQAVWVEEFYSRSRRGCVRGLHFQSPPMAHDKLVYCAAGAVFDAVVDLRRDSPAYGRAYTVELDAQRAEMLFAPRGLAHGFQALTGGALMVYKTTAAYSPAHDTGIRFDSADIRWPLPVAAVSERDLALPPLDGFESPFARL